MGTVSIHFPDELQEELDEFLDYGDSRSEFVSDAVRDELDRRKGNDEEVKRD